MINKYRLVIKSTMHKSEPCIVEFETRKDADAELRKWKYMGSSYYCYVEKILNSGE